MPKDDQRQPAINADRALILPDSIDYTDAIVEISLKLAAAARKRSPKTWPVTHLLTKDE